MRARGFTLLEVMIALTILGMSLAVLLQSQATSLASAGRARDVTIAAMLARSKMVDIEQELFKEGFTVGTTEEEGDFAEEGQPTIKWKYAVSEIELDLSSLTSLCGGFGEEGGDAGQCESLIGGLGAPFESLASSISQSVRLVDLTVTIPNGQYSEKVSVRTLVTREDLGVQPSTSFVPGGAGGPLGTGGGGLPVPPTVAPGGMP